MTPFIETVKSVSPPDPSAAYAWELLVRGAEVGWIRRPDIAELLGLLRTNGDWISDELGFTYSGDQLRVNLLDDDVFCDPAKIIEALVTLQGRLDP